MFAGFFYAQCHVPVPELNGLPCLLGLCWLAAIAAAQHNVYERIAGQELVQRYLQNRLDLLQKV